MSTILPDLLEWIATDVVESRTAVAEARPDDMELIFTPEGRISALNDAKDFIDRMNARSGVSDPDHVIRALVDWLWMQTAQSIGRQAITNPKDEKTIYSDDGRLIVLSDIHSFLTDSVIVRWGHCEECNYIGVAYADASSCPGCHCPIEQDGNWRAQSEGSSDLTGSSEEMLRNG